MLIPLLLLAGFWGDENSPHKLRYHGNLIQGGLVEIQAPQGTEVILDGYEIREQNGHYFIGFTRDAAPHSMLEVEYPDGTEYEYQLNIVQRTYNTQSLSVAQNYSSPSTSNSKRIEKETFDVAYVRRSATNPCPEQLNFARPASGIVTGVYGSQRYYNGKPAPYHSGTDFAGPTGAPVYAPAAGEVKMTEKLYLTGNTMVIDHGCGITSTLLHMSAFERKPGDIVNQGELVGRIGQTGIATGPHLHWNVNLGPTRLDPLLLLQKN